MQPRRIVIVDYGLGNLFNVYKAFAYQEIPAVISGDPRDVTEADALVIPGVGAFQDGMKGLEERGLVASILDFAKSGRPVLGICLGMQMLMEEGFEMGRHRGLGLIEGSVLPFRRDDRMSVKIPHMGWNRIRKAASPSDPFLQDTREDSMFYFVHSYFVQPKDPGNVLAVTEYGGVSFCSIVSKANVYGCQFHPEKSGAEGLALLRAFSQINREVS